MGFRFRHAHLQRVSDIRYVILHEITGACMANLYLSASPHIDADFKGVVVGYNTGVPPQTITASQPSDLLTKALETAIWMHRPELQETPLAVIDDAQIQWQDTVDENIQKTLVTMDLGPKKL